MTVDHMRSPSLGRLLPWRHTRHLVRPSPSLRFAAVHSPTNTDLGLQTPRLKRLAEIVSAQAIAQQEKLEYGSQDGEYDDQANDLAVVQESSEAIEAGA